MACIADDKAPVWCEREPLWVDDVEHGGQPAVGPDLLAAAKGGLRLPGVACAINRDIHPSVDLAWFFPGIGPASENHAEIGEAVKVIGGDRAPRAIGRRGH